MLVRMSCYVVAIGRELKHEAGRGDSEFDQYQDAPLLDVWENPMAWWKTHQNVFPRLARLARKYLAVPATSVPSERMFSSAGNFDRRHRSRLDPDNLERAVLLHHHFMELRREIPQQRTFIPTISLAIV